MYKIDFLSGAPRIYIFERYSNKTNLGGILTLIYLGILLLIIILFILDYTKDLKYSVVYSYNEEYLNDMDEYKRKLRDENLNPEITYKFGFISNVDKSKFFIITNNSEFINFGEEHKSKVYDIYLYIGYNCEKLDENNYDCSLGEIDDSSIYVFYLNYTGFKTEHQDNELPLQKYMFEFFYFNSNGQIVEFLQKWKTIKYTEDLKEYYGGVIMNDKMVIMDISEGVKNTLFENGKRLLCIIRIEYPWINYIDNYTRSKRTIIDVFGDICSLCLTIYNAMIFGYSFLYARNYDNYTIIEKILSKSNRATTKNKENDKMIKRIR